MVDNVTREQFDLVPYCLQYNEYKIHKNINSKLHRTSIA